MGSESGQSNPPVAAGQAIAALTEEPHLFEFFQAVRLLLRWREREGLVGGSWPPDREAVRFRTHPALAFPPSEIRSFQPGDGEIPPELAVWFFGLTGPLGVLPTHYSAFVLERLHGRDATLRDFLDLFHHRLISLFYRAWEKYRYPVSYERGEDDRFSQYLRDLIGIGTTGLAHRQAVPDDALLFYAGLLGQQPRSIMALERLLEDYFGVPAEVEPFAGAWRPVDPAARSCLNEGNSPPEQLGFGVILGGEVWDQQSVVRIRLGPLTLVQYRDFLPDGAAHAPLRALIHFFCGDDFDVEAQLVLKREEAPRFALGVPGQPQPRLGWVSWMFSQPLGRDPDDTILHLWEG